MQALGIANDHPDAEYGFLLHDAGKVGIPERILSKPGPLTAAEWRVMRTHPLIGYQMVSSIPSSRGGRDRALPPRDVRRLRLPRGPEGRGDPDGGAGVQHRRRFDAMTTDRPYRAALPLEYAAEEVERMGGTQFDPDVAKVFAPLCERLVPISAAG
jgi:HD-GYP domain